MNLFVIAFKFFYSITELGSYCRGNVKNSVSQLVHVKVFNVPVKSKLEHSPGQPPGHLNFCKIFV